MLQTEINRTAAILQSLSTEPVNTPRINQSPAFETDTLLRQHTQLPSNTTALRLPPETTRGQIRTDNPVTRHFGRKRIAPQCLADRTGRSAPDCPRNQLVRRNPAARYAPDRAINLFLKFRYRAASHSVCVTPAHPLQVNLPIQLPSLTGPHRICRIGS
jgi:hypothetical protein